MQIHTCASVLLHEHRNLCARLNVEDMLLVFRKGAAEIQIHHGTQTLLRLMRSLKWILSRSGSLASMSPHVG